MFTTAGPMACAALLLAGLLPPETSNPTPSGVSVEPDTPDSLVAALYQAVTFRGSNQPDWDVVRSYFIPEATVVLRTARTETHVFSVDGFVQDFQDFIDGAQIGTVGFTERVVRMRTWTYRDMAHVLVLYEASIPGSGRPPQQGVDSFLLTRREGVWRIAAVTNEVVRPEDEVPWG